MSDFGFLNKNTPNYTKFCIVLADGTKVFRMAAEDCPGCNAEYEKEYYTDVLGTQIPTPDLTDAKECSDKQPDCVQSQEWTYGIDNTGTHYEDVATYCLELSDGSTLEWSQGGNSTAWDEQLTEWATNIQTAATDAGLEWFVEPRFVDNVTPTSIDGTLNGPGGFPSGLPGAPSVPIAVALVNGGMFRRYVNFQICPGQPVPTRAFRKTSQRYGDGEFILTAAGAVLGPILRFWLCTDCGSESGSLEWLKEDQDNPGELIPAEAGEIPNCWEPCGTLALTDAPPDRACEFILAVGCDNNNSVNTVDFTNTITRRATICNGKQIAVDYFQVDNSDDSALVVYELQGDFVDCATGIAIDLPTVDGIQINCEEEVIAEAYDTDVRIIGSKHAIPVFLEDNCCVTPANLECIKKRTFEFVYDNGQTPGSSTNDGGERNDIVRFQWTFEVNSWETGAGDVGVGEAIGPYSGWSPQLTGWSTFGTDNDPYNSVHGFEFYGTPTWRGWSVIGCNPDAQYGVWEIQRDDGVTFKVYPTLYTEIIETVYRSQEADCDGNITTRYWIQNADGQTYSEVETPDNVECFVPCDHIFPPVLIPGAESPCSTKQYTLCDRVNPANPAQDVQFVQIATTCDAVVTTERYTLDSYNTATDPDGLVEYQVVGDILVCSTGEPFVEAPPICEDFTSLGNLWIFQPPAPGTLVEWWADPNGTQAGTAVAHDSVSNIFSLDGDTLNHVSGPADNSYISPVFSVEGSNASDFLTGMGGLTTADTTGTDQAKLSAHFNLPADALVRDGGTRTGERGSIWLDTCCTGQLELIAERTEDTVADDRGVFNNLELPAGIHYAEALISDLAAWWNLTLEASFDGGVNWGPLIGYQDKPAYVCTPVIKCTDSGLILHAVTGEVITVAIEDQWCEPTCEGGESSDIEAMACLSAEKFAAALNADRPDDIEVSLTEGCNDVDGDPANYINLTRQTVFTNGIPEITFFTDFGLPNQATFTGAVSFVECVNGNPIPDPPIIPECEDWEVLTAYQPQGVQGVNVERWSVNAVTGLTNSNRASDVFTEPVDYSSMPGHANGAPDTPVIVETDLLVVDEVDDQSQMRGWTYFYTTEPVRIRENRATAEAIDYYLGECCGEVIKVAEKGADTSIVFDVDLDAGIHFIGFEIYDFSAFSGVDYEISTDGGVTWVRVPAAQLFATKTTISACPVKYCPESNLLVDAMTGALLGPETVLCPPQICGAPPAGISEKTLITEEGEFADTQARTGFMSMTVQVSTGSVDINGATYTPCSPLVLPVLNHGNCRYVYPEYVITPEAGTQYTLSVQSI